VIITSTPDWANLRPIGWLFFKATTLYPDSISRPWVTYTG
jgi:hypothetical protein